MNDLPAHVRDSILSRQLLRHGQQVLVAVSGGLDSMVLLCVLAELSKAQGWRLAVAHFNHKLRGRSSDADEHLVGRVTKQLHLPFIVEQANVRRFARAEGLSLELAARKLRHDFLARTAEKLKAPTIALAHHADDQVELFFLRLFRGSGGEGLGGMKWRGPSPANQKLQLVRPLLDQSKEALGQFAAENEIDFREDATNASLDIQRNRIRHELLPLLRRNFQPRLEKAVLRAMEVTAAEAELATELARAWLKKGETLFSKLPTAVQRRVLQLQLFQLGLDADFDSVEHLRLKPGTRVNVKGSERLFAVSDSLGRVRIETSQPPRFVTESAQVALKGRAGEVAFAGVRIQWRLSSESPAGQLNGSKGIEFFDADQVGSAVILRHWCPGDRFQPIGMARAVKLQDFFTNQKVPRPKRHELLVAASQQGEVFWVEGQRISERFKLTNRTIRCLQWHWQRV